MADASTPLGHYLRAIWEDGIARMGSGLGIVFAFAAAYFAFVAGHSIAFLWLLALLSFLFASYRVWRREYVARVDAESCLLQPKLTGFFHDVSSYFYYGKGWLDIKQGEKVLSFSPPPILGMEVVISLRIINSSAPTTVHSFSLVAECEGKKWFAPHAEEAIHAGEVPVEVLAQAMKARLNFASYLDAPNKQIAQGSGIDGVLVFRLAGMTSDTLPTHESSLSLTLYVEDASGKRHPIEDRWNPTPRPSLKLRD
jgi:hypothetical protein